MLGRILGLVAWLMSVSSFAAEPAPLAVDGISLTTPYGTHVAAYVAGPQDATRAVLILHDRYGLNDPLRDWVQRFAAQGYRALAIDMYGGRHTRQLKRANSIIDTVDPVVVEVDVNTALDYLARPGRKVAILGFDYGADKALAAALRRSDLAAAVLYYPRNVETDQAVIQALPTPLLLILAGRDEELDPDRLQTFSDIVGKTQQVQFRTVKINAPRGFADPISGQYDEKSASAAWQAMQDFLSLHMTP